jgi:hypothetical protein
MTLSLPWHSIRLRDRNVYHDNELCPTGQAIDPKYRKQGAPLPNAMCHLRQAGSSGRDGRSPGPAAAALTVSYT